MLSSLDYNTGPHLSFLGVTGPREDLAPWYLWIEDSKYPNKKIGKIKHIQRKLEMPKCFFYFIWGALEGWDLENEETDWQQSQYEKEEDRVFCLFFWQQCWKLVGIGSLLKKSRFEFYFSSLDTVLVRPPIQALSRGTWGRWVNLSQQ